MEKEKTVRMEERQRRDEQRETVVSVCVNVLIERDESVERQRENAESLGFH